MKKELNGKNGISIKIITSKIRNELNGNTPKKINKRTLKNVSKRGKIQTSDLQNLNIGLGILEKMVHEGFNIRDERLLLGKNDISKAQKNIVSYRSVMEDFLRRISSATKTEYQLKKREEDLANYSKIAQAARDGIILKKEKRIEVVDGTEKEITYDTSMSPKEVISILENYKDQTNRLTYNKLNNYLGLGMGIVASLGALIKSNKSKDAENKANVPLVTMGTLVISGMKLLYGLRKSEYKEQLWKLRDQEFSMTDDLQYNEQISSKAEESTIQSIQSIIAQEKKLENKLENRRFAYSICLDLATAIIAGAYINKMVMTKEDGKIDGRSFVNALLSFQSAQGIAKDFVRATQGIVDNRKEEESFQHTCAKVREILKQMDEKVYPLEGAKHSFNSISIKNFTGNFYPKMDYETGEIKYSLSLKIPEFSMKRGDVVLLSGESGTGKSTLLRFLKRGDINNRNAIQLDNGEMVDNLGDEYISFRPNTNLGNETNVLFQITGKRNISDLKPDDQKRLKEILGELKFDSPDLLEQLASKKFMEFSTGQQRRLALSKMFYRIEDGTSVIIVDEPVGNVENSLIREQLEMIKQYAKKRDVMLILTTHRLELAEDLATKRYNINKEGVLEQLPVKQKEQSNDFIR